MKLGPMIGVALLSLGLLRPCVYPQGNDRKANVLVALNGSSSGTNYRIFTVDAEASNITLAGSETGGNIQRDVLVKPGLTYAIGIEVGPDDTPPQGSGSFEAIVTAPPGYTVFVGSAKGLVPTLEQSVISGMADQLWQQTNSDFYYYFQIVEKGALTPGMAGKLTRLSVSDLVFELGLGTLKNGKSAGRLQLRHNGRTSGGGYGLPSDVFAYWALRLVGAATTGLTAASWQNLAPGQRLETGQVRVDVIPLSSDNYSVLFYAGDNSGGYSSSAYATYSLEKVTGNLPPHAPPNADCFKLTEVQGNVTVLRYVFRSTVSDSWTLIEGEGSEQRIETHTVETVNGEQVETITVGSVIDSSLVLAGKSRVTWTPYSLTVLMTKSEVWTDVAAGSPGLTTCYEFYTAAEDGAGDRGKLKKATYPNGGFSEYDYYDDAARFGRVQTVTEPWSTGGATTLTKVTTYDYTGPSGGQQEYLSAEETTIGGTTVAKAAHGYTFGTMDQDHLILVVRTSTLYVAAGSTLTTLSSTYAKNGDFFFANRPYLVQTPDGRQQSFRYQQGTYSGGAFTAGTGNASRTLIATGSHLAGTPTNSICGLTFASIMLVGKQSTLSEIIRDNEDNILSEKTYVWDGANFDLAKPVVSTTSTSTWMDGVRQTVRTEVNGARQDWIWHGAYPASTTNADGVELTYHYDTVGRVRVVTRTQLAAYDNFQTFDELTTTFGYDAANRQTSATEAGGSLTRETRYAYDGAGRPTGVTLPDGRSGSTTYSFPSGNLTQVEEALPGGATRTTQTLVDGKVKQVEGNADVKAYYSYMVDSYGRINAQVDYATAPSARWQQTVTDWLGRLVVSCRPGFTGQADVVETSTYSPSTGLLTKVARTGFADEYRSYDAMGNLVRSGTDFGANVSLAATDPADRVADYETVFDKDGASNWWVCSTQTTYPSRDEPSTALVTGKKWTRLTGLGGGTLSDTGVEDSFGNRVNTVTTVDRTKRRIIATTTYPQVNAAAITIANNGLTAKMTGTDGRSVTKRYDSLGRLVQQGDSRTGSTSYTYWSHDLAATDRVWTVTNDALATVTATYTYDAAGRISSRKDAGDNYAYFDYDTAGRLKYQWGAAKTPVEYGYNGYGEMTDLKTFRHGTWTGNAWPGGVADATTFTYDPASGLLTRKEDNSGSHVDYTYNDRGLVETREWHRVNGSGQRVKTTYAYEPNAVELAGKTYNDGTPGVAFTYTRLGQMKSAGDVSNGTTTETRTIEYDSHMRPVTEKLPAYLGSRWITYTYESAGTDTLAGRASGYTLGVSGSLTQDLTNRRTYNPATGQVQALTAAHFGVAARTFAYDYVSNTSLIREVYEPVTGYTQTRAYEESRDLLEEFTTKFGTTTKTRYDYKYNSRGQRRSAKQSGQNGTAFADYGNDTFQRYVYNSRGELQQAMGFLGTNEEDLTAPLPGRNHEYGYDEAGNRTSANTTGVADLRADYTPNGLNQIDRRENHYVTVSGTVDSEAKVVVNGGLAGQQGKYWSGEAVLANTNAPVYTNALAVKAARAGSPATKQISGLLAAFIPMALEDFNYDSDGNLTGDGQWSYSWDAENRLTRMQTNITAMGVGLPGKSLVFRYDSLGRRTVKEVWHWSGSTWSQFSEVRFVYQGWNLIAELTSTGARQRTYAWGLDLSGSLTAMGGIGALVQMVDHTGTVNSYLPGYDGSGNVAAMMRSDGAISAAYEYGPFGEPLRRAGAYAANPFRSATKYTDDESGLVYYGHRYYNPSTGRFINRDPIGEEGGLNLYAFVGNNGVNRWDLLGQTGWNSNDPSDMSGSDDWSDSDWQEYMDWRAAEGRASAYDFNLGWQEAGRGGSGYIPAEARGPTISYHEAIFLFGNSVQGGGTINILTYADGSQRVSLDAPGAGPLAQRTTIADMNAQAQATYQRQADAFVRQASAVFNAPNNADIRAGGTASPTATYSRDPIFVSGVFENKTAALLNAFGKVADLTKTRKVEYGGHLVPDGKGGYSYKVYQGTEIGSYTGVSQNGTEFHSHPSGYASPSERDLLWSARDGTIGYIVTADGRVTQYTGGVRDSGTGNAFDDADIRPINLSPRRP